MFQNIYFKINHIIINECIQQQNENGPCPLLAVANILLLRGSIDLPAACLRSSVASASDVISMLANRALSRATNSTTSLSVQNKDSSSSDSLTHSDDDKKVVTLKEEEEEERKLLVSKQSQYNINELMSVLPKLVKGLDVNPKFTSGVEGYEYTQGVAALFDLLGVDLVHGWLVDPQEEELFALMEDKSYNQCVEMVVKANDARDLVTPASMLSLDENQEEGEWVDVQVEVPLDKQINEDTNNVSSESEIKSTIRTGTLIQTFLTTYAHQLTYHGLHTLHTHVKNNTLSVFFRNNHFSTITKHNDILYLLITDAGYADNSTIIWERLDHIDGDSDFVNSFFQLRIYDDNDNDADADADADSNMDYQLALQLSKETSSSATYPTTSFQQLPESSFPSTTNDTRAIIPPKEEEKLEENPSNPQPNTPKTAATTTSDNYDEAYAFALQAQYEADAASERLARQLHNEEEERLRLQRSNRGGTGNRNNVVVPPGTHSQKSCVIS